MFDYSCERAVLGTIIRYNWAYPQEAYRLSEDLFTHPLTRHCFQAIQRLEQNHQSPDLILLTAEVRKEIPDIPPYEIIEVTQYYCAESGDFSVFVGRLNDLMVRRKIHLLGQKMVQEGKREGMEIDDLISLVDTNMKQILQQGLPAGTSTLTNTVEELEQYYFQRQEGKLESEGTYTGFPQLDEGGGLTPGQLTIIAGATSHGKTSLALSIVDRALEQGTPVAFFSLEMGRRELAARFLAMESGISSTQQLHPSHPLDLEDFNDLIYSVQSIKTRGANLFFDDHFSSNINHIVAAIRSMHYQHHIRGVVIDYLQILGTNQHTTNREQLMGEVARQLKNIAVELDLWIIALSQLNRDSNAMTPSIDRLRDSGQIAEAADRVLLLYRPEAIGATYPKPFSHVDPHNTALLNVVKNRNGQQSQFIVSFTPSRTRFDPIEGEPPRRSPFQGEKDYPMKKFD